MRERERESGRGRAGLCVIVVLVLVVVCMCVGAGGETLQCLGSCISASPTVRDAFTANACLLRVHLTRETEMKSSGNWAWRSHIARCMPRRQSGALHSRNESPWREFLMENGDRRKVLQHRLLAIYPDYLHFQRIVAWSAGSLPPAIHVSNPQWKRSRAPMRDNFGLDHFALPPGDTPVTLHALSSAVM